MRRWGHRRMEEMLEGSDILERVLGCETLR